LLTKKDAVSIQYNARLYFSTIGSPLTAHRYVREFEPFSGNSLALLADRIPAGAIVLELGPAGGYFTRHLHETLHCTVDAVEIDPLMADAARVWCRTMIVGNLETLDLPALLPAHSYDVVLMADVLEHLRDPAPVLQQLHSLLKADGCCLISVPNVAYGGLIVSLLGGEFEYREEGLLDQTHLRFYTRRSLAQLLVHTGWFPGGWQPVPLSFWDSEFRTRLETLPTALVDLLASRPELSCYQWLVEARAEASAQAVEPALADTWPGERFPVRLFWTDETEPFAYERSQILWGQVGARQKVEEFVLNDAANATLLRFRLSDRPGFMHLYEVVLRDADQNTLWQWRAADGVAALSDACSGLKLADAEAHALLLIHEEESWLDLAWRGVASPPVRTVQLTFGWPQSADFVAAQTAWVAAELPLRRELAARDQAIQAQDEALHALRRELDAVKTLVGTRDHELATRDQALQAQDEALHALRRELDAVKTLVGTRDRELAARDRSIQAQGEDLHALRRELDAVKTLVGTRDAELATRDRAIQAQGEALHALRRELDAVKTLVGTRDHELATRDRSIQAQGEDLHALRRELDAVKTLVGTRDHELATRDQTIQAQQKETFDLRQRLDAQIARSTTLQAQLAQMQTFSGWIKQPLHGLRKLTRH
jgi:2-polyprenyl-3-methyl-5-hydroxy-6-metoxy-1,4-benzoquinol methylase